MIEPYHYAGFSVQTAMAKEQRDRDAADELIRLRKTPRYCGAERTSFWRMPKIEYIRRKTVNSNSQATFSVVFSEIMTILQIFSIGFGVDYATERYTTNGPFPLSQSPCWARAGLATGIR
jgi:hypothetical protein